VKKQTIQVRRYEPGQTDHGGEAIGKITGDFGKHEVVETIKCKCWAESIGNFSPIFCRYKNKRTLVHSDEGDLSDPFRATEDYLKTLFITV
jgi:hypothetical protein